MTVLEEFLAAHDAAGYPRDPDEFLVAWDIGWGWAIIATFYDEDTGRIVYIGTTYHKPGKTGFKPDFSSMPIAVGFDKSQVFSRVEKYVRWQQTNTQTFLPQEMSNSNIIASHLQNMSKSGLFSTVPPLGQAVFLEAIARLRTLLDYRDAEELRCKLARAEQCLEDVTLALSGLELTDEKLGDKLSKILKETKKRLAEL